MTRVLGRDIRWASIAQMAAGGLMVAYLAVVARSLASGGRGSDFALFQATMSLFSSLFALALPLSLATVHLVGAARPEDRTAVIAGCLKAGAAVGGAAAAAIWLGSPLLVTLLRSDGAGPVHAVGALLLVAFLLTVCYGALQGQNRYREFALLKILEAGLSLSLGGLLLFLGQGVAGAIVGYALGMGTVLTLFLARADELRHRLPRATFLPDLRPIGVLMAVAGVVFFSMAGPMIVARWRLSDSASLQYAALYAFRNVAQPFALAAGLPLYSRIVSGHDEDGMLRKALSFVGLVAGGLLLLSVASPSRLLHALLGPSYFGAADYLGLYALTLLLFAISVVVMFFAAAKRILPLPLLFLPVGAVGAMALWPGLGLTTLLWLQVGSWGAFLAALAASVTLRRDEPG